jgi:hypothetical protein
VIGTGALTATYSDWVSPGTLIEVRVDLAQNAGDTVPLVIGDLTIFMSRARLTELRDCITAALGGAPENEVSAGSAVVRVEQTGEVDHP